jgi:hypothetical protein
MTKGGFSQELVVILVDDAFAHLSCHKRNAGAVNEPAQHLARELAIRPSSDQQQRMMGARDQLDGPANRLVFGKRPANVARSDNRLFRFFASYVLRQFKMCRTRSLFLRPTERFANG